MNKSKEILKQLKQAKSVFEKWGLDTFIIAVNSLENFIRVLSKYDNIDKIPEEVEKNLLEVLRTSYMLDGRLTTEILKGNLS